MKAWPIAAVCVALAALVGLPPTTSAEDALRIARLSRPVGADADVLVSVPRALSGRTLAPSAFTVAVDGTPVAATATREVGAGFDVALVIETSASASEESFVATKAAAVEFVLEQPTATRVAIVASDPPALTLGFTTDRAAIVDALKKMSRAPGAGLIDALGLAARTNDASHRVTIVAATTAAVTTVPAGAAPDDRVTALRSGPSQLFAVGVVSAPLAQLAADTGGFATTAEGGQLVGAFDSVAADLAGRYRLTFPVPADATRLDLRVTAPEGTASVSVLFPAGAATGPTTPGPSPATSTGGTGNSTGIGAARAAGESSDQSHVLAIALVVGALGAGALVLFVARRSRRRRAPSPAPAAVAAPAPVSAPAPTPTPAPPSLDGYALTALCDDAEIIELRAAVASCGIVVSQARSVDEALRDVVTGRARALYVDSAMSHARELTAAVRQRNDAGWSSCPTLVHASRRGPADPAIVAAADAIIPEPIDASYVVAALATRP